MFQPNDQVQYKTGRGWAPGTVKHTEGEKVHIERESGTLVIRHHSKVKPADTTTLEIPPAPSTPQPE